MAHQRVLEGEPKALMQWATAVGVNAQGMIGHHLNDRGDVANGVRAARRMRDLARDHGEDRFESVCRYALPLHITSLRSITSILTNQADLRPRAATPPPRQEHDNLRGAQYFGD